MALNAVGVKINGQASDPGTLNNWLVNNNGYTCADGDCNNLVLDIVNKVSGGVLTFVSEQEKQSIATIQAGLQKNAAVYLAHVRNNHHFVLLTSWNDSISQFNVNDPFYNVTSYPYENITDIILYTVGPQPAAPKRSDLPSTAVIPLYYPLYKQCDPRWGNDTMVNVSICAVGCLMSSTSMAIAGKKILIASIPSNPGVLNSWLRNNGGYDDDNDLEEGAVPKIAPDLISWPADGMHTKNDLPISAIKQYLIYGRPVIANVMHGGHFVLVVGRDAENDDTLYVNDPGFNTTTYSYSKDVVGWRLYEMRSPRLRTERQ